MWGMNRQNVVFAVGHSIINRSNKVNVGSLLLKYGGGGHFQVGTCQVDAGRADYVLAVLTEALTSSILTAPDSLELYARFKRI